MEYNEYEESYCEQCSESNPPMVVFGNLIHYNCRYCGWWWKEKKKKEGRQNA